MSYSRNQIEYMPEISYNEIRQQQNIHPVRGSLKINAQRPDSYNQYAFGGKQSYGMTDGALKRNSIAKIQNLRRQVHQVIDLCKGQNTDVKGDFNNVVEAEKDIYNLLLENPQTLQRVASHQSIVHQPQSIVRPSNFGKKEQSTPIMQKNPNYVPQSIYYIPHFSQVGVKDQNVHLNMLSSDTKKPESMYIPVQDQYSPTSDQVGLQNSFNLLKKSNPILLNDDALRLIEEIERKAFEEIQKLRKQKIELMQKLNQQIRNVNEERKKNLQLERQLQTVRNQFQRPDGTFTQQTDNIKNLQLHINRLEDQLRRAHQINSHLKLELNQRGAGVPGIEELLRQGELIRQDTLRLLKLKQSGSSNERVYELERLLAQQRAEKQQAFDQIKVLRQRLGGASRTIVGQSKVSQQPISYGKSVIRVQSPHLDRSSNQYQDLLSQMKRITGY